MTTITPKEIYKLICQFYKENPPSQQRKKGRPRKYQEELIILLLLLKVLYQASYRKLLSIVKELHPDTEIPSLNNTFYRLKSLPEERLHKFLKWLAHKGIQIEREKNKERGEGKKEPYAMVDGTGVGYNTPFYLRNKRGQEIKKIRAHVKVVAVCYWEGGRNWAVGISIGEAYSDEGKLLKEMLLREGNKLLESGTIIVGDRLYGMRVEPLEIMERLGYRPVVCSMDTMRMKVRSEVRIRANQRAKEHESILKGRYRIEQVFGSIKSAYGSYLDVKKGYMAKLIVMGMFILWNMVGLLAISRFFLLCIYHKDKTYALIFGTPWERI